MFSPGGPGLTLPRNFIKDVDPSRVGTLDWVAAWRDVTKFGTCLDKHEIFGTQNAAICTWLLKKWCAFWYCIIWLDVFLVFFVGCFFVYFWRYMHMIRPELDEYQYGCHGSGEIWWLCVLSWGGENFAKSEVSKMITVANGYTGWWQLKYFLCSALLGEMIQFD